MTNVHVIIEILDIASNSIVHAMLQIVPRAMFNLISTAIDMQRQSHGPLDCNYIYSLIPDPELVLDRWVARCLRLSFVHVITFSTSLGA